MSYPDLTVYSALGISLAYSIGIIAMFYSFCTHNKNLRSAATGIYFLGFILHTFLVGSQLLLITFSSLATSYFVQLFSWSMLLVYFVVKRRFKFSFLSLIIVPLALLLFISSLRLESMHGRLPAYWGELFFFLHVGPLFLSLALLTMAFGAALLFVYIEKKIKQKASLTNLAKELPDLASFDRMNKIAVSYGLPLYTLGLVAGFIWDPLVWGKAVGLDPKYITSVFVWVLYAFLFHQRVINGWRGRKAAIMVIWIFAISAFSFIGIMPTRHGSMPGQGPL